MNRKLKKLLVCILLCASINQPVYANNIFIDNSSFEDDVLLDGEFIASASSWVTTGNAGTFNPNASQGIVTEGNNVGYAAGGSLTQVLSEVLTSNTHYELSVDVIERLDSNITDYTIQLLSGTTVIAQDINLLAPTNGSFLTSIISYSALAGDILLGSQLSIALSSTDHQVNFDSLTLNASSISAVPEPTSLALLGLGLAGFSFSRKKKLV